MKINLIHLLITFFNLFFIFSLDIPDNGLQNPEDESTQSSIVKEFDDKSDYGTEIEKIIGEHIEKFGNKENKYNGNISLIKISNKIDKANETAVENQL